MPLLYLLTQILFSVGSGAVALLLRLSIGVFYVVLMTGYRLGRTAARFLHGIQILVRSRVILMPIVRSVTTPSSATWRLVLNEGWALRTSTTTPISIRRRLYCWHRCRSRFDWWAIASSAVMFQFLDSFSRCLEIWLKHCSILLHLDMIPCWKLPRCLLAPNEVLKLLQTPSGLCVFTLFQISQLLGEWMVQDAGLMV